MSVAERKGPTDHYREIVWTFFDFRYTFSVNQGVGVTVHLWGGVRLFWGEAVGHQQRCLLKLYHVLATGRPQTICSRKKNDFIRSPHHRT